MKKIKRLTALVLAAMLLLCCVGCEAETEDEKGMELRAAFIEEPATLDPVYATTEEERTIVAHLFENLMKYSPTGLVPAQAMSYTHTVNDDGTETYVFTLRSDIYWSDGEAVTAYDFVHAWQRLVSPAVASPDRAILEMVKGYEEAVAGDVVALAVAAPDSKTFEVTLTGHCPYFLSVVCTDTATMPTRADVVQEWMVEEKDEEAEADGEIVVAAAVPDWSMKKSTMVNNGAYSIRNFNAAHLTVVETEGYYDSHRLGPKEIDFFFAETLERAMSSYDKGESDFVLKCGETEGSVEVQLPEMHVLVVNQMSSLSETIRQALTLSLDRNAIAAAAGTVFTGAEGLVPEGVITMSGNLFRQVNGAVLPCDEEGVEKSRATVDELLGQLYRGGIPLADRLGVLTLLYEGTFINGRMAYQVQQQWKQQLGINVELVSVESEEMQKALESGAFTFALMEVSHESNTAMGYLDHYVSSNYENYGQHYSNAYDILLRAADASDNVEARDAYLADAERMLLESGYVIPLCVGTYRYLLRETLTGLVCSDMGVYNFSSVFEPVV